MRTYLIFVIGFLLASSQLLAQGEKEINLIADGNKGYQNEAYIEAEVDYRKALSINSANTKAQHNIGNALYRTKDFDQANQRYFQTQKNSLNKSEKHLAFHNMGNGFMQQKMYEKAVEAYKNALRNNPTDDETRYNYALAKELLEKEKQEKEENQDQQDQNDQNDQQDQQDNQDDKEGDQKEKPSEDGEEGDEKENKDDQENKDKDEKENKDKEKEDPKKPKDDKGKNKDQKKPPPPRPGQISPEQVKSLLEAMNQQEKNVQDKVNAEKAKGVPVKTKKDW
ncbi:MAG: tetratricopeptide repeat protein [Flavobacteriaceae bacterium]|nr:tetratricopeptide repeat protein [Flavobacteriaceae bacterium]